MKGFETHLLPLLQPPPSSFSPELSNGYLPQRQGVNNLKSANFHPRSSPSMLKLFSSSAASRAHHLTPAIRTGASSVESPLLKALSHFTGLNRRSNSLGGGGRRVFFCSDNASDAAAAEAEAKAAESDSDGSESKSSSAIVPTNPRPEDCLTVSTFNCIKVCGGFIMYR